MRRSPYLTRPVRIPLPACIAEHLGVHMLTIADHLTVQEVRSASTFIR